MHVAEKPTANDIARVAGVSPAPVDSVLTDRRDARTDIIRKVQHPIDEIGYFRDSRWDPGPEGVS